MFTLYCSLLNVNIISFDQCFFHSDNKKKKQDLLITLRIQIAIHYRICFSIARFCLLKFIEWTHVTVKYCRFDI